MIALHAFTALLACAPNSGAATAQSAAKDAPARAIVFDPKPGVRLARTITIDHDLGLQSMSSLRDGIVQRSQQQLDLRSHESLSLVDELRKVGGGRPLLLARGFTADELKVELTLHPPGGQKSPPPHAWNARMPLTGASIVFTWIPEENDWARYYDGREEAEEALADIAQDVDALALLPTSPVAPGATWSVPAAKLRDIFAPSGSLPRVWPNDIERALVRSCSSGVGGGLSQVFGGGADGKADVRFDRVETRDGAEVAVLTIEIRLTVERDQADLARVRGSLDELPGGGWIKDSHVRWVFQGAGELAWDLGAKRMQKLAIRGQEDVSSRLTAEEGAPGGTPVVQDLAMSGKFALTVETRPAP